ncbi:MAG: hypothetical protein KDH96_04960 [Candidatus Riesia sp.]|nr:hypothetical protein [Candidatus Riesia sp.]
MIAELIGEKYTLRKLSNNVLTTEEHGSLKIWTNTNSWYWFARGFGGGIREWLRYANYPEDEWDYWIDKDLLFVPPNEDNNFIDYDDFVTHCIGAYKYTKYIKSRNISEATAKYFGLETKNSDTIIPIIKYNNERIGSLIRHKAGTPKYHKFLLEAQPVFWNSNILDINRPTLIFEGAWSVMRFWQVLGDKYNYLATLSFSITDKHFEYLTGLDNVYWFLDYDTDNNNTLLPRVWQKRNKIKVNNGKHRVIINKTMPDEISDEGILACEKIKII